MDERIDVDLGILLQASVVERVLRHGALLLDVDDTILLRDPASGGGPETFAKSPSAALLPELLSRGFTLGLITGHGWKQLESRLIAPLRDRLAGKQEAIEKLHVYANRGATKILWDGERHAVDEAYAARYKLRTGDVETLSALLNSIGEEFSIDFEARPHWYRETYPRFDFASLPPTVGEREGAVLVLRPVPTSKHAESVSAVDVRDRVYERGLELLQQAKLSDEYEIARSGRSSIEITRRGVSKEAAMRDLIFGISASSGDNASRVEASMVYVGDEFFPGGNDYVMPTVFPSALCLSVAGESVTEKVPAGVVSLMAATGTSGPPATEMLLRHFCSVLTL